MTTPAPLELPTRVGDTVVITVHRAEHLRRFPSLSQLFEEASPYVVATLEAEEEEPTKLQIEAARCGGSNPRWVSQTNGANGNSSNQLSFEILPKTKKIQVRSDTRHVTIFELLCSMHS